MCVFYFTMKISKKQKTKNKNKTKTKQKKPKKQKTKKPPEGKVTRETGKNIYI